MAVSNEELHKELDLIQQVIGRMASNSFEVKKWLIGILMAILVFKSEELLGGNHQFMLLLLIPIICFWYLDAFFLSTEKTYRELYKWVVTHRSETHIYLYDLNTFTREFPDGTITQLRKNKHKVPWVMISKTLWPFYALPLLFILVYSFCV